MENARTPAEGAMLKELARAFAEFRGKQEGRRVIPAELRRLAVDAARATDSVPAAARACGVAPQTVRNWVLAMPPPARRLAIAPLVDVSPPCSVPEAGAESDVSQARDEAAAPQGLFVFRLSAGIALEAGAEQTLWLVRQLGGRV